MPPPAGGCVFLIGRNTSSVTSLIMGLAAAAPNRPAPGSVPGKQCTSYDSNALVTRALHYLLSSAMLPQIVHCPRATSSRAARSHRYLVNKPPTPVSMSMPPRNGRQFNRGRGRGDLAYRLQDSGCLAPDDAGGPCFVDEVTSVGRILLRRRRSDRRSCPACRGASCTGTERRPSGVRVSAKSTRRDQ